MPALELSYDAILKQLITLGENETEESVGDPGAANLYSAYVLCVEAMASCASELQQAPFFQSIADRGLQFKEGKAALTALLHIDQELAKPHLEEVLKSAAKNSSDDLHYLLEVLGIPGVPSFTAETLVHSTTPISPVVHYLSNIVEHAPSILPAEARKNIGLFAEALRQCSLS
jgi:hypothetical protein